MIENVIAQDLIEEKILFIRGLKVMLDKDLANLYGVETRSLKQAVKRNIIRFPPDFMFILKEIEINKLVSQNVIPSKSYFGGTLPMVFTEQGISMISSVLNSDKAIQVNIQIMRTFTKLRKMLISYKDLKAKIEEMEQNYDYKFKIIFDAINKLLLPPTDKERKKIGF